MQELAVGITHEETIKVTSDVVASRYVAGTPEAFATPALVALIELAAANGVRAYLDPAETTVGTSLQIKHTAPTPIGMLVRCQITLVEVDRRRLRFEIAAWDDEEQICAGQHERFVINAEKFAATLKNKTR